MNRRGGRAPDVAYRPAEEADLAACTHIWSAGIEDYVRRLNQPWFGGDLEPLRRLLAHFRRTDPERFLVATSGEGGAERVIAFVSATVREQVWFLGMLFVLPEFQARGIGRTLLERALPAPGERDRFVLATATDSLQPISNALYGRYGLTPRVPVMNLVGRPHDPAALPPLPAGVRIHRTDWTGPHAADASGHEARAIDALDRAILGYAHPADHDLLRAEGRHRFLATSERGDLLGYGYIASSGRFGPVAASDPAVLAPLTGHLVTAVPAPGAYASWIPGAADTVTVALLRAGFRFESFPTLLLWTRPFADFGRYVPTNLALL